MVAAADAALARGEWWGPFHGVPGTIKDTVSTAGVRTTAGAPFLSDYVPAEDAVAVERLEGAGIVVLGKTNVPFMASDWQSYNEIFGQTNNPWDLERTPGGSTGGGAAALAAGLSYLSIGSDIGGSIRIPAHYCGVYGHKPTLDVVPRRGHIPPPPSEFPSPSLDLPVAGPLARSATDLKTAMQVLGGPDRDRAVAYSWSLPPARGSRLRDYRIGFATMTGLPATAAPVGRTPDGLPVGIQILGPYLEDATPIDVAAGLTDVVGGFEPPPGFA